jgi:hypothetical protein
MSKFLPENNSKRGSSTVYSEQDMAAVKDVVLQLARGGLASLSDHTQAGIGFKIGISMDSEGDKRRTNLVQHPTDVYHRKGGKQITCTKIKNKMVLAASPPLPPPPHHPKPLTTSCPF